MNQVSKTERNIALGLIAFGVILRLWLRTPTDFWEDEIIASTHAVQPFWQVIIDCIRNDTHPPLYFLQLHIWGWLGHSDIWLTLNSVAWSLIAIWSLWQVATRLYGDRVALFAAAIFAVIPTATYMADQLRMYSMLSNCLIWSFYLSVRIFRDRRWTAGWLIGHGLLLIAIVNTHAIASVAVLFNGLYALQLVRRAGDRRGLVAWFAIYGLAAVCAVPWLVSGMLHDANLGDPGGLKGILVALASTTLGVVAYGSPLFTVLGVAAYCAAITIGLSSARTKTMTWIFLIAPIVLSIALGLLYKPIFKWNFFSTLVAPFIALVLALVLDGREANPRLRTILAPLLLLVLCAVSLATRLTVHITTGYRDRADFIRANYRPGDIVFTPQQSVFQGMAWYLDGPDWGSPFVYAAPPSPQWQKVYNKLGPKIVKALHLVPDSQMLERSGISILVGNDSAGQAMGATRIWLLTMPRADLKPGYPPPVLDGLPQQWSNHNHTWATLYAATPQQVVTPSPLAPD